MEDKPLQQDSKDNALQKSGGVFHYGKGLAVAAHISGYIIGPLLIFAGIGWWLDKVFNTSPFILLGAIFLAFIVSNVLILKRASEVVKSYAVKPEDKNQDKKKDEQKTN